MDESLRLRVLLVDDSEIVTAMVAEQLENHGFDVRAVNELEQLASTLSTFAPHLVLTDVTMPGQSGAELCRWLKTQIATSSIPIVLFSDAPAARLALIAEEAGADAFVSKTVGAAGIASRVRDLCDEVVW